jgi:cytoskeletal protein CcmA (bactofilin family)
MKIKVFIFSVVLVFSFLIFGLLNAVYAASFLSEPHITVEAGTTVDGDLFASGEVIIIEGTVNGDVFAAGQTVLVKGTINGDLYAVTETLEITGVIRDDVLFMARAANFISGKISGSIISLAETVIIDSESRVGGSVLFALKTLVTNGNVGGSITGSAESITINSGVSQNMRVNTNNLRFGSGANVTGDIFYHSPNNAVIEKDARLHGELDHKVQDLGNPATGFLKLVKAFIIWSYLSSLITGLVILLIFKRPVQIVATQLKENLGPSLGWGVLLLLIALPMIGLLLVTIIGIPLALLLTVGFGVSLYVGKVAVGLAIGNWLLSKLATSKQTPNLYAAFVVGLSAYYLLKIMPVINVLAVMAVMALGVGSIALSLKQALFPVRAKK